MTDFHYPDKAGPGPMIRGWYWNVRMSNGAVFSVWTPRGDVSRKSARLAVLRAANRADLETGADSWEVYEPADIETFWRSQSQPKGDLWRT